MSSQSLRAPNATDQSIRRKSVAHTPRLDNLAITYERSSINSESSPHNDIDGPQIMAAPLIPPATTNDNHAVISENQSIPRVTSETSK